MNINDDHLARLDLYSPLRIRNIPLDVKIITPIPDYIMNQCRQEVATLARIIPPSALTKDFPFAPEKLADRIVRTMPKPEIDTQKGGETYAAK